MARKKEEALSDALEQAEGAEAQDASSEEALPGAPAEAESEGEELEEVGESEN